MHTIHFLAQQFSIAIAYASTTPVSIPLPSGFAADIGAQIGQFFSDFSTFIVLILGLLGVIALYEAMVNSIRTHGK
jgi:hypothetical protein